MLDLRPPGIVARDTQFANDKKILDVLGRLPTRWNRFVMNWRLFHYDRGWSSLNCYTLEDKVNAWANWQIGDHIVGDDKYELYTLEYGGDEKIERILGPVYYKDFKRKGHKEFAKTKLLDIDLNN